VLRRFQSKEQNSTIRCQAMVRSSGTSALWYHSFGLNDLRETIQVDNQLSQIKR
jgi:hypothetical protein